METYFILKKTVFIVIQLHILTKNNIITFTIIIVIVINDIINKKLIAFLAIRTYALSCRNPLLKHFFALAPIFVYKLKHLHEFIYFVYILCRTDAQAVQDKYGFKYGFVIINGIR